jgi:stage II sporulation protein D
MWVKPQKVMKIFRRSISPLLATLCLTLLTPTSANATFPEKFIFTGSGYGHGVGMSQIGARGMALESATAVEILQHFYPSTIIAPVNDTEIIRVNVGHQLKDAQLSIQSKTGAFQIARGRFGYGEEIPENAILASYGKDATLLINSLNNLVELSFTSKTGKYAAPTPNDQWTIRWDETSTTLLLRTAPRNFQLRYGQINLASVKNKSNSAQLEITTSMRLHDQYLYGLGEVPSSWPEAALQAQAIAGRTFALTKMRSIRPVCDCNIFSTTRDQNYVGFSKESEPFYGIRWKSAVDESRPLAILFQEKPIQAFYFSSSGGATQNVKDVWGSSFSYLISRPDSWSVNTALNPRFANWSREISQSAMAKAFELKDVARYQIINRSVTGSVLMIRAISTEGQEKILSGEIFRSRVGLPSTWINILKVEPIPISEKYPEICSEEKLFPIVLYSYCLQ